MAITCCRIITFFIPNKTGTFKNTSKIQILRITTDVLTSNLCRPFFSSMPFLLSFMGAVCGKNLSFSGKIFNADLLYAGDNLLVGDGAFICGHLQQSNKFILGKIKIGNNVTLGVRSFIMPNVTIGDNSIIAAYSVVTMGTKIPNNEIWGGIPAKKIGNRT
ncbi:DapH/DapD/GlmU-related protein [uncultured Desulfobacter sp.]|uniref:acyltransferase n=1 Tax=uncultured Desulfobacter sp. TaxID=240139 RepID=UPI0029F49B50|nr:DapH/DapD/GlmU-related protein [uncultured Desulfobacter sp.]